LVAERRAAAVNQDALARRKTGSGCRLVINDSGRSEYGEPHELDDAAERENLHQFCIPVKEAANSERAKSVSFQSMYHARRECSDTQLS
jgi:hypothetical protein